MKSMSIAGLTVETIARRTAWNPTVAVLVENEPATCEPVAEEAYDRLCRK